MKTKPEQSLACVWCWCFLPAQPLLILEECVSTSPRGQSRYHLHRYPFVTGIEPSLLAPPRLMHSQPMFATFHYTVHRETRFWKRWLTSLVGYSFVSKNCQTEFSWPGIAEACWPFHAPHPHPPAEYPIALYSAPALPNLPPHSPLLEVCQWDQHLLVPPPLPCHLMATDCSAIRAEVSFLPFFQKPAD